MHLGFFLKQKLIKTFFKSKSPRALFFCPNLNPNIYRARIDRGSGTVNFLGI